MFELNPLNLAQAWWQHSIMLIVAGIIGYIIGYRSGNTKVRELHDKLAQLNIYLQKCRKNRLVPSPNVKEVVIHDDLKLIEGIGPKIELVLNRANIFTFNDLREYDPLHIQQILAEASPRFRVHEASTWPRQAALAAAGKWEELKKWQDELDGGKESY